MLALLASLSGNVKAALVGIAAGAAVYMACSAYDRLIDDPAVASAARAGLVSEYQVASYKALNAALLSALQATKEAAANATREQLALSRAHEIQASEMENKIEDLEKSLRATGRSWILDQSDIDRVRNNSKATERGG